MTEEAVGAPLRTASSEGEAAMWQTLVQETLVQEDADLNLKKVAERKETGATGNKRESQSTCAN